MPAVRSTRSQDCRTRPERKPRRRAAPRLMGHDQPTATVHLRLLHQGMFAIGRNPRPLDPRPFRCPALRYLLRATPTRRRHERQRGGTCRAGLACCRAAGRSGGIDRTARSVRGRCRPRLHDVAGSRDQRSRQVETTARVSLGAIGNAVARRLGWAQSRSFSLRLAVSREAAGRRRSGPALRVVSATARMAQRGYRDAGEGDGA